VRLRPKRKYLLTQHYVVSDHGIACKHSIVLAESDEAPAGDQTEYNGGCRRGRFILILHR
jgi:hypothetical protein